MIERIFNYYAYNDNLAAGGQPTAEQIEALKQSGFDVIVNISPASARNALQNEHQLVERWEMDYIHFPVDCSNLRETHYLTVAAILNSLEGKKVFMHCGGNIKTSNLIHMYHVLEKGMNEQESFGTLRKIQNPENKWLFFFKKMGMKGDAL
ncbi:MAG TPA: protein tyrosine phosphatase family protein [Bacteroidales bacterium]|nr:protein tyrosine phosphatase family protein [Bacteroidales bacterium]